MDKTKIDWCDSTWNPVTGCLHDCPYCYARGISNRFGKNYPDYSAYHNENPALHILDNPIDGTPYPFGFEPTFHYYRLGEYKDKKRPRNIFVCSMADLFGEWVPTDWIIDVFNACREAPQHNYLFLTKNPKRYAQLGYSEIGLPAYGNMWYGSTVTSPHTDIYWGKGVNTFLSIEPILEPFGEIGSALKDSPPKWVIIGAETGKRKNKVKPERKWVEDIVEQCRKTGIPVFMKSSLADIWGEPLIQELPEGLRKGR